MNMRKKMLILVLLMAASTAALAQEVQDRHLDIIFVIDSSGSMNFTDPEEFRKVAVKAFIDITQDRGGDRIAVLQFAGWNETTEKGPTVFPLTEIPRDEAQRNNLLSEIREAVTRRVSAFGKGTDFNFAFEKAVASVLQEREKKKTANKAWVILLTDGTTDVKEGGNTRQEYVDAADEAGQKSRKALNEAAQEYFADRVLPLIARWKDVQITCVNLTEDEPSPELRLLAEKAGATILRTTREALRAVFVEALASLPKGVYRSDLTRGFACDRKKAGPGTEVTTNLRVYQGTTVMRALVLSNSPEFTVDLDLTQVAQGPASIKLSPGGEPYKVISLLDPVPGEYPLKMLNRAGKQVAFEVLFLAQFGLTPGISVKTDGELHAGDEVEVVISLSHDGKLSTDRDFLRDLEATVTFKLHPAARDSKKISFAEAPDSSARVSFKIPEKAPGEWMVEARFRALKQTLSGEYAFAPPPASVKFTVLEKPVIVAEKPNEPEPRPQPEPRPPGEPEPEPPVPEPETPVEAQMPSDRPREAPEERRSVDEDSLGGMTIEFAGPAWYVIVIPVAVVFIALLLFLRLRKPKGPVLEFGDQQLWSAGGDARLLADMGEGGKVSGTPEIPNAVLFRLTGSPAAPLCQVRPGPEGRIFVDKKPVDDWTDLHHNAKIEVEAAGRPEVPIYKYTYFDRDPSAHEQETVTRTVKIKERDTSIKPEDIFPTDVLERERAEREPQLPPDDDELIIFDDN